MTASGFKIERKNTNQFLGGLGMEDKGNLSGEEVLPKTAENMKIRELSSFDKRSQI